MKYITYSLLLLVFIFQSCSVEKRHYTSGYHIEWKKGTNSESKVPHTELQTQNSLIASAEKKKGIVLLATDSIGCDTLIMKNGTEIKVKVLEVTPTEVKYKYCSNINGPLYVAYRYNISYVKYANGTMDSFVNEHPPVVNGNNGGNRPNNGNYNPGNGGYNQNNGGAFNGNNNRYSMDNYAVNEYVRKMSLWSLICGIVSIFIPYVGFLIAIAAIILGTKSMRLIRKDPQNLWMYGRRAMAGQIIGWIVAAIYLLVIIGVFIALGI